MIKIKFKFQLWYKLSQKNIKKMNKLHQLLTLYKKL